MSRKAISLNEKIYGQDCNPTHRLVSTVERLLNRSPAGAEEASRSPHAGQKEDDVQKRQDANIS
jgi:hypothetical protein